MSGAPATTADLRAVLALIIDLAAVVGSLAVDVGGEIDTENAYAVASAARRMAAALSEPKPQGASDAT